MKPFIVLIAVSLLTLFIIKWGGGAWDLPLSARIGMSAMLVFTAVGHFVFAKGMTMMVPDFVPLKKQTVYFTGIIEVLGAVGLHIPGFRTPTAWLLIVFSSWSCQRTLRLRRNEWISKKEIMRGTARSTFGSGSLCRSCSFCGYISVRSGLDKNAGQ